MIWLLKIIILPRQARDKRRKQLSKTGVLCRRDFQKALGGAAKSLTASTSNLPARAQYEMANVAVRGAMGVGSIVFTAARRHPKIFLATLAAPFLYKLVKPAVQSAYQQLTSDRYAVLVRTDVSIHPPVHCPPIRCGACRFIDRPPLA